MQMPVCDCGSGWLASSVAFEPHDFVFNALKGSCGQLAACYGFINHRLNKLFHHLVSVHSSGTAQKEQTTFLISCRCWTPTTYLYCRNAHQPCSLNVVCLISCWIRMYFHVCSVCSSVHVILPHAVGVLWCFGYVRCGICINKAVTILGFLQNWGWVKCWSSLMWVSRKYTFQLTYVMW